jgi:hypothetical protein
MGPTRRRPEAGAVVTTPASTSPAHTRLYIIGPMTGKPDYNRPAFHTAAKHLRSAGFHVINPAETPDPVPGPEWEDWIRAGITHVLLADGLALLPGTGHSRGAKLELHIACELDLPLHSVAGWLGYAQTRNTP